MCPICVVRYLSDWYVCYIMEVSIWPHRGERMESVRQFLWYVCCIGHSCEILTPILERHKMAEFGQNKRNKTRYLAQSIDRSAGFTLIELMVSIVIIAIMVAAAVPAVNGYLTRHAPQYAAEELWGDIQLARLRAARNNQRCQIQFNVPGPNQYTLQDFDNNGAVIPGGPFKVVNLAKFRDNITFVPSPIAANPPPYAVIEFLSQGIVNVNTVPVATAPANTDSIYLTNQAGDVFYRVLVSLAGGTAVYRLDMTTGQWRTNQ